MHQDLRDIMLACTRDSVGERVTFPEILGRLQASTIERYHTDLCRAENIFYTRDGRSEVVPTGKEAGVPAEAFSAEGVASAVRATQVGRIRYNEFCRQVLAAGCAGWWVSLPGRRVVYYGRTGETHVEHFPGSR